MKTDRLVLLGLICCTTLLACDDDPFEPVPISPAEAEWLSRHFVQEGLQVSIGIPLGQPAAAAAGAEPIDFSTEVSTTVDCPLGGSISVAVLLAGAVDSETGEAEVDYTVSKEHLACEARSEDGSIRATINGTPAVVNDYDLVLEADGTYTIDGSITGGFDVAIGDKSGNCALDVAFSGAGVVGGAASLTVTGTVCGTGVSETVTVEG